MNKIKTLALGTLSLVALTAGCNVDVAETPEAEEIATNSEAIVCSNDAATASIQAGMAVAAAMEMQRWNPRRDLECSGWDVGVDLITGTTAGTPPDGLVDYPGKCIRGPVNNQFKVGLSPKAWPRCPNRNCRNMAALLRLQDDAADGMVFGGQPLSVGVLRSRIYADWQDQFTCINRPDNGQSDNCPIEDHDLKFQYKAVSSVTCDGGFDFWFKGWKMGSGVTRFTVPLSKPAQLRNLLMWAGYPENPFLAFANNGSDVKIDPTGGTAEGSSTTSGSCTVVSYNANLNRCGAVYSATNITNACCKCNNVNKKFAPKSGMPDYYVCQ